MKRQSLQLGQALKKIGLYTIIQKAHKLYTESCNILVLYNQRKWMTFTITIEHREKVVVVVVQFKK